LWPIIEVMGASGLVGFEIVSRLKCRWPARKAIEKHTPECLFANWQGVMIGDGEVSSGLRNNGTAA
jgi:hypothetical protein